MGSALKNTYDYFENNYKGKKLLYLFLFVLVASLIVGIFVGQIPALLEGPKPNNVDKVETIIPDMIERSGRVVYSNPELYPDDNVSYKLLDDKGAEVILLTANDDKLRIIENSNVKLRGKLRTTQDGTKEILIVEEVIFN